MVAIRLPNSAMNASWWARPMSSREERDRGAPDGEQSPENTAACPRHSFALPCLENAGVWGGAPGNFGLTRRFCRRAPQPCRRSRKSRPHSIPSALGKLNRLDGGQGGESRRIRPSPKSVRPVGLPAAARVPSGLQRAGANRRARQGQVALGASVRQARDSLAQAAVSSRFQGIRARSRPMGHRSVTPA
jgi:hypothetical protein